MGNHAFENLIVDNPADRLFRVNRRVFTDPSILEAEKHGVFDRSWIYAGHESEIPKPGDFRASSGREPNGVKSSIIYILA